MGHKNLKDQNTGLNNASMWILLAGSTLEGPIAFMALLAFGLSFFGTLTVADEVQNYLHLFSEAQRSDCKGLSFAMRWTLLGFNRNLERHLETRGEFIRSLKLLKRMPWSVMVPVLACDVFLIIVCFEVTFLDLARRISLPVPYTETDRPGYKVTLLPVHKHLHFSCCGVVGSPRPEMFFQLYLFHTCTQTATEMIVCTSSPMEMLEHFLPFSPVASTPFLQMDL